MVKDSPFKNQYLIYTRKSTDDADNQKNSIAYQKSEALRFARLHYLSIADFTLEGFAASGIITERHTAFKEDHYFNIYKNGKIEYRIERPKFARLSHFLQEGYFKGVIFLCWDRASRNEGDDNVLNKLMRRGVDIRFVQVTYDSSSAGELHKDIDGMFSHHYSRVIREKVLLTNKKLKEEGICTYRAPVGYLNLGDPRHKPFDPERAPIIRQLFEKYADGNVSLFELARWANRQGLTMRPVRRRRTEKELLADEEVIIVPTERPLTFKNVQKILTNRFYTGMVLGNGGIWVKSASHEPLIEKELFARVQERLKGNCKKISHDIRLQYPYRGLFRCASCNRVFTPYEQKDRLYYGARCENCANPKRSFARADLEYMVAEKLALLHFTEEQAEAIRQNANASRSEEEAISKERERRVREKGKLLEDLNYLKENKIVLLKAGVYTPQECVAEEERLVRSIKELDKEPECANPQELCDSQILFSELSKTLHLTYLSGNPRQKEVIMGFTFSELRPFGNSLQTKAKNAFTIFENPFMFLGDPKAWYSEAVRNHHVITDTIAEIRNLIKTSSP